jgi:CoA-transferase family III
VSPRSISDRQGKQERQGKEDDQMTDGNHIFSGLKVLDLASFIAGPAATTILADFGADVVKVEPLGTGDPYRFISTTPPNPVGDFNYAWQLTNRNKRSIALDLKSSGAKEVLLRLVTVWRRPARPHFLKAVCISSACPWITPRTCGWSTNRGSACRRSAIQQTVSPRFCVRKLKPRNACLANLCKV